ncbi:MAG: SgcJ/EcaC family oxidoreductase [Trebonia sp.]
MAQIAVNEAVDQLSGEIAEAWNAGDARAYGARYCPDGTFTNTDGTLDLGRDEVVHTAEKAFQGILAGTKLSLAVRKLRLVRPDVAVVDLDTRVSGMPGGEARISQMLVLVEEDDRWWITAQHNLMQSAGH